MRLAFMGTPAFALPALDCLAEAGHDVAAVYTQPDRGAGRGRQILASPVKQRALELGLPVRQPVSLRASQEVAALQGDQVDVLIVVAYGKLLPPAVLEAAPHGALNLHPSLLPRFRGPSPIAAAILAGDEETGVTLIHLDAGMDSGPIVGQARSPIASGETAGSLGPRLSVLGARLLAELAPRWVAGEISALPQDDARASYCPKLTKDDGALDWSRPVAELERAVRAYNPWPGAFTLLGGKRLKVLCAHATAPAGRPAAGTLVARREGVSVAAEDGELVLDLVQVEGRRPVAGADFVRGQRGLIGRIVPS